MEQIFPPEIWVQILLKAGTKTAFELQHLTPLSDFEIFSHNKINLKDFFNTAARIGNLRLFKTTTQRWSRLE